MKKKIMAMCLVIAMAATAVIGGTLAYFTDTDKDVNVMTMGTLEIVQNETKRDGTAYEDKQVLYPAVYYTKDANFDKKVDANETEWVVDTVSPKLYAGAGPEANLPSSYWRDGKCKPITNDDREYSIYADNIKNEIDKFITVTNRGTEDAYVRTIILFEENEGEVNGKKLKLTDLFHWSYYGGSDVTWEDLNPITIDNQKYWARVCTYLKPVEGKNEDGTFNTTQPSLGQVWVNPMADENWYNLLVDNQYEIIAFSQATQTAGFDNATQALDAAFGDVTESAIGTWLKSSDLVVKTTELQNVVGGTVNP